MVNGIGFKAFLPVLAAALMFGLSLPAYGDQIVQPKAGAFVPGVISGGLSTGLDNGSVAGYISSKVCKKAVEKHTAKGGVSEQYLEKKQICAVAERKRVEMDKSKAAFDAKTAVVKEMERVRKNGPSKISIDDPLAKLCENSAWLSTGNGVVYIDKRAKACVARYEKFAKESFQKVMDSEISAAKKAAEDAKKKHMTAKDGHEKATLNCSSPPLLGDLEFIMKDSEKYVCGKCQNRWPGEDGVCDFYSDMDEAKDNELCEVIFDDFKAGNSDMNSACEACGGELPNGERCS